ncbi:unnamed protein product, partial [Didymodactylos carnosus]
GSHADMFSKFFITKAVRDCSSTTAAQFLLEEVILKYGTPKELVTNGSYLTSALFESLLKLVGSCHIRVTPYHPQANRQCERYNATFLPKVLTLANSTKTNWDEMLLLTTFNYNNTQRAITKFTSFELMYSRNCRLLVDPVGETGELPDPQQ